MFNAEFTAIGRIWESVFKQGAFFFDRFISTVDTADTKWYLLIFSAFVLYGITYKVIKKR